MSAQQQAQGLALVGDMSFLKKILGPHQRADKLETLSSCTAVIILA